MSIHGWEQERAILEENATLERCENINEDDFRVEGEAQTLTYFC